MKKEGLIVLFFVLTLSVYGYIDEGWPIYINSDIACPLVPCTYVGTSVNGTEKWGTSYGTWDIPPNQTYAQYPYQITLENDVTIEFSLIFTLSVQQPGYNNTIHVIIDGEEVYIEELLTGKVITEEEKILYEYDEITGELVRYEGIVTSVTFEGSGIIKDKRVNIDLGEYKAGDYLIEIYAEPLPTYFSISQFSISILEEVVLNSTNTEDTLCQDCTKGDKIAYLECESHVNCQDVQMDFLDPSGSGNIIANCDEKLIGQLNLFATPYCIGSTAYKYYTCEKTEGNSGDIISVSPYGTICEHGCQSGACISNFSGLPDIVPWSVQWIPKPTIGNKLDLVYVNVKNIGPNEFDDWLSTKINIEKDGNHFYDGDIITGENILPGWTTTVALTSMDALVQIPEFTSGSYRLEIIFDENNLIEESDDENNILIIDFDLNEEDIIYSDVIGNICYDPNAAIYMNKDNYTCCNEIVQFDSDCEEPQTNETENSVVNETQNPDVNETEEDPIDPGEAAVLGACPPDQVLVCHYEEDSHELCIAEEAVKAHLDHLDYLGFCDEDQVREVFSHKIYRNEITKLQPLGQVVRELKFKSDVELEDANIAIRNTKVKPHYVRNPIRAVSDYIIIDHPDIDNEDISESTIEFSVTSEWLALYGRTVDDVVLSKYVNNVWIDLETRYLGKSGNEYYFEADSSGLSVFVITLLATEDVSVTETTEEETIVESNKSKKLIEDDTLGLNADLSNDNRYMFVTVILVTFLLTSFFVYHHHHLPNKNLKDKKEDPIGRRYKVLIEYVKENRNKGKSDKEIIEELKKARWAHSLINEVISRK